MDLEEVRRRIAAADSAETILNRQEFESFCSSIVASLPRSVETAPERAWAYEQIINLRIEDGRPARALRVFKQYLGDCARRRRRVRCNVPGRFERNRHRNYAAPSAGPVFFAGAAFSQDVVARGHGRGMRVLSRAVVVFLCSTLQQADAAFDGRGYRIFDSFAGLSAPSQEDAIEGEGAQVGRLRHMTRAGNFAASLDKVKAALSAFPRIEYFPGWIPAAFPQEDGARYRFVHVDVDVYQPTRDSIDYFYPRLVPGGMIVCDDYNWSGARQAIEEVCARVGTDFATTPYTQAYIVRRT